MLGSELVKGAEEMGMSTEAITVERAKAIIKSRKLSRVSWSTALRGQQPVAAELSDDGRGFLIYTERYPHLFAEYE